MNNLDLKIEISDFDKKIESIMSGEKALSYSKLSSFLETPKHYYEHETNEEVTPAMKEGQIFHCVCLELENFNKKYWILDDAKICEKIGGAKPRGTNDYKEWKLNQELLNKGKELVSIDDYNTFINMSDALRRNKASKILINSLTDKEFPFEFEYDQFKIKGKIDGKGEIKEDNLFFDKGKYIIDLKKVADASYKKIRWDIRDKNLDLQGGLYSYSQKINNYYLVFIDKKCNITIVNLIEETLNSGFNKFENSIKEFQRCAEENAWQSSYEFYNGGFIRV